MSPTFLTLKDLTKEDWFIITVSLLGAIVFILFFIFLYLVCTLRNLTVNSRQKANLDALKTIKDKIWQEHLYLKAEPNIYFVGLQGTGKSSLINSLVAAVNKEGYTQLLRVGKRGVFDSGGITDQLKAYKMSKEFYESDERENQQFHFCPILWDCPPFMNENSATIRRDLEHLIRGALLEGTKVHKLPQKSDQELEAVVQDKKGDLIVLVLDDKSEPLPTNFISALVSVAAGKDQEKGIPIIFVINKTDKMHSPTTKVEQMKKRILAMENVKENIVKVLGVQSYQQDAERGDRRKAVDKAMCQIWISILDTLA